MSRRYVKELGHQEDISEVYLASGKQLRPNRNGNLYLQVELSDSTGIVSARMWNADDRVYRSFDNGDFIRVEGTAQLFQGAIQVIATGISRVPADEVNQSEFLPLSDEERAELRKQLEGKLRAFEQPHLRGVVEAFLADEEFMKQFCSAPAGIKHHHAYPGGLLEHVVQLMGVAEAVCGCYPALHKELLLTGVFLHDMGKLQELGFERDLYYTDHGQLLGHLVIGVEMLEVKLQTLQQAGTPVPADLATELKHMIVSHHGEYEFGSPRLPMTSEALALHMLDNLDSKLHAFDKLMEDDPNVESNWTTYQQSMSRKLFKKTARSWE